MKKKGLIPCKSFISIDGAPPVPWESLTKEQHDECCKRMMENCGKALSREAERNPDIIPQLAKNAVEIEYY